MCQAISPGSVFIFSPGKPFLVPTMLKAMSASGKNSRSFQWSYNNCQQQMPQAHPRTALNFICCLLPKAPLC